MERAPQHWIAVLDDRAALRIIKGGVGVLPLARTVTPRPAARDRLVLLLARGPLFVSESAFAATADVVADDGDVLRLRHRVVAPKGHEIKVTALHALRVSAGWTHPALGGLLNDVIRTGARDYERIEGAVRDEALQFGPKAMRPTHRRPRTPGRRALLAGRAAAGRRPG